MAAVAGLLEPPREVRELELEREAGRRAVDRRGARELPLLVLGAEPDAAGPEVAPDEEPPPDEPPPPPLSPDELPASEDGAASLDEEEDEECDDEEPPPPPPPLDDGVDGGLEVVGVGSSSAGPHVGRVVVVGGGSVVVVVGGGSVVVVVGVSPGDCAPALTASAPPNASAGMSVSAHTVACARRRRFPVRARRIAARSVSCEVLPRGNIARRNRQLRR